MGRWTTWIVVLAALSALTQTSSAQLSYHDYNELDTLLGSAATRCPTIMRRFSVGTSVGGRELFGMRVTKNVGQVEAQVARPSVRLAANMHGDETVGREMLVQLVEYLCDFYGDPLHEHATWLVDHTQIYIIPSLNPDGYELGTRENMNGIDLNRDYPNRFNAETNTVDGRQPETVAMMQWSTARTFALAANMHGGALVVSYPWDASVSGADVEARTADDQMYRRISHAYASLNAPMFGSSVFADGITNGAAWYHLSGSLQDWSVRWEGVPEVTLELSTPESNKSPPASTLQTYWDNNKLSILNYIYQAHISVAGRVIGPDNQALADARCVLDAFPEGLEVKASALSGRFWRVVEPGTWDVTCTAPGMTAVTRPVTAYYSTRPDPRTDDEIAAAMVEFHLTPAAEEPPESGLGTIASGDSVNVWVGLFLFLQLTIATAGVVISCACLRSGDKI